MKEVDEWEKKKRDVLKDLNPNYVDVLEYIDTPEEFEHGIFLEKYQKGETKD